LSVNADRADHAEGHDCESYITRQRIPLDFHFVPTVSDYASVPIGKTT